MSQNNTFFNLPYLPNCLWRGHLTIVSPDSMGSFHNKLPLDRAYIENLVSVRFGSVNKINQLRGR
jgi:hypothetical protein